MCNDETNIAECIYDGGDCCGACINTDICSECTCHEEIDPTIDFSCMQHKLYINFHYHTKYQLFDFEILRL